MSGVKLRTGCLCLELRERGYDWTPVSQYYNAMGCNGMAMCCEKLQTTGRIMYGL